MKGTTSTCGLGNFRATRHTVAIQYRSASATLNAVQRVTLAFAATISPPQNSCVSKAVRHTSTRCATWTGSSASHRFGNIVEGQRKTASRLPTRQVQGLAQLVHLDGTSHCGEGADSFATERSAVPSWRASPARRHSATPYNGKHSPASCWNGLRLYPDACQSRE